MGWMERGEKWRKVVKEYIKGEGGEMKGGEGKVKE